MASVKSRMNEARKQAGLTQAQLAEAVNVSRQTINSLEKNKYNPSLALAYNIKKALGARFIEDVFHFEDQAEKQTQPTAFILSTTKLEKTSSLNQETQ